MKVKDLAGILSAVSAFYDAGEARVCIRTEEDSYLPTIKSVDVSVADGCVYLTPDAKLWDEIEHNKKDK